MKFSMYLAARNRDMMCLLFIYYFVSKKKSEQEPRKLRNFMMDLNRYIAVLAEFETELCPRHLVSKQ